MDEILKGLVSCRALGWIFDLCNDRHIDPQRILKYVNLRREELQDPIRYIDWNSFLTLFSNLGNYFTEDQLLEAGVQSWEHASMLPSTIAGRLLRSSRAQFIAMYGERGLLAALCPVTMQTRDAGRGHLEIRLMMSEGLRPCRWFQIFLAGQMSGLTTALGEPEANVHVNHTQTGATFDIWYQPIPGPLSLLRRLSLWLASIREGARILSQQQDQLLDSAARLEEASARYRQLKEHSNDNDLRYKMLEHNVKDVIFTMDCDLRVNYISASVQGLCGYTVHEVLAMEPGGLFSEPSLSRIQEVVDAGASDDDDEGTRLEIEMRHKQGNRIWAELTLGFSADEPGHQARLIGVINDISERKSFEEHLSEREASYQAITTTAQDAIITVDEHNIITFANLAASRIFDYDIISLEGRPLANLIPDTSKPTVTGDTGDEACPEVSIPLEGLRKDGHTLALEASFAEHQLRGRRFTTWIIRDVTARARIETERKQLEQQLQAIQRMESIGQLTGGIAHDFNNLLVAINGYADLALTPNIPASRFEQYVREIRRAGGRAADMTQKLLAFSRRQIIEPTLVDVNDLIKGLEKLIGRLLPENIHVRCFPALQNPAILADAGQIEQVLVNLAVNARDAMPDGGNLTISVDVKDATALEFTNSLPQEREFTVIRVEDSGHGMTEEVTKRIFEPFFTTKPEGSGTGLGLAVAFGIVKQHEGYIAVSSEAGKGTRFDIYLPIAEARLPPVKKDKQKPIVVAGGSETLLLVEDNTQVRDLARLILVGAGYQVIEASDGVEALDVFRQQADNISLVIMDVVMPRMGGKEVMDRLREIRPDIRILFSSGYSSGGIHTNFILQEGLEFIQKPYDAGTLRARVRQVLDAAGGTGGDAAVPGRG